MKGTSGYVWDPTIGLELLFVAQISATEGEDVKEVIWYVLRVFLFAIVFVFVSDAFIFTGMITGGSGGLV